MGPRAGKQKNINFYKLIGKLIIRSVKNTKYSQHFKHILITLIKSFYDFYQKTMKLFNFKRNLFILLVFFGDSSYFLII